MKKSPEVVAAEAAYKAKEAELISAKEQVKRLESEWSKLASEVRGAATQADASQPQCDAVTVTRSGNENPFGRHVIVRKTPTGILVTRNVGEPDGYTYRFKWRDYSGKYVQAEKGGSFAFSWRELRNVPAEFMPNPTLPSACK